jgi:hypothetical protein
MISLSDPKIFNFSTLTFDGKTLSLFGNYDCPET